MIVNRIILIMSIIVGLGLSMHVIKELGSIDQKFETQEETNELVLEVLRADENLTHELILDIGVLVDTIAEMQQ